MSRENRFERKDDEPTWGSEEDPHLIIATDAVKRTISEKQAEKEKRDRERKAERERIEADPAYQQRQANLKRYSEILAGIGQVETSWNKPEDFRIELENLPSDCMDALIDAICKILSTKKS